MEKQGSALPFSGETTPCRERADRQREQHDSLASSEGILADQITRSEHEVNDVFCSVHAKRGAPPAAPRNLRVDYRVGFNEYLIAL